MWTGGKPPPIPKSAQAAPTAAATGGVVNTNKGSFRPGGVLAELEQLKARGLATILNKHFTEETHKLALEKAAADAALKDLEERKKNTGEFHPSGDGEISPLDSMYLSVHKWRNECRRKERETLLLYQRYVSKFGSTGQVKVPTYQPSPTKVNPGGAASDTPLESTPDSTTYSNGSAPTPTAAPPAPPSGVQVPSMAAAIESALEEYILKGAVSVPSVSCLGKDTTYQSAFSKEEAEFRNYYRRQLEGRGVDVKAPIVTPDNEHRGMYSPELFNHHASSFPFLRTIGEVGAVEDQDEDCNSILGALYVNHSYCADDDSVVSGLTYNSAMTREILEDCNRTVATFLQEEQQAIRRIMETEGDADGIWDDAMTANQGSINSDSELGSVSKRAAEQAESMAKQMEQILIKFKSSTASVAEGAQGDEDDADSSSRKARRLETSNPGEEWMVYYDETYEREYYHERNSNKTQWDPPDLEVTTNDGSRGSSPVAETFNHHHGGDSASMEGRRTSTRISQYRRMRRRQRKRRIMAIAFCAVSALFGAAYYLSRNPESPVSRLVIVQVAMPVVKKVVDAERLQLLVDDVRATMHQTVGWVMGHANDEIASKVKAKEDAERALVEERKARFAAEAAIEAQRLERLRQEEEERLRRLEKERLAQQEAAALAAKQEEANRLAKQEADRLQQERLLQEEAERQAAVEAERLVMDEEARLMHEEMQRLAEEQSKLLQLRPWQCNIPLAYLFDGQCFILATQNPPFDLWELVMSMMQ